MSYIKIKENYFVFKYIVYDKKTNMYSNSIFNNNYILNLYFFLIIIIILNLYFF